jgi:hypothetical protein
MVATVAWLAWMAWQTTLVTGTELTAEPLVIILAWAVGPPLVLYLLGIVAGWVARGFQESAGLTRR